MSDIETPHLAEDKDDDDHRDLDELGEKLRKIQETRKTKEDIERPPDALPQSGLGIGLRIGMELVVSVMMGLAIGWFLDRTFGTEPWGLIVFFMLGFAAGILNVVRVANKASGIDGGADKGSSPPHD